MKVKSGKWKVIMLACVSIAFSLLTSHFSISQAQVQLPGSASRNSQGFPSGNFGDSTATADSVGVKGLVYNKTIPDSVLRAKVFFFNIAPLAVKINEVWNPSLDPTGVQYNNDPIDAFNGNYYLGKGVLGHPHLPIFYRLPDHLKINLQQEEFEVYLKKPENVRFYQTMTPYSLLSYNNSLNKDYRVHLAHTQNIIPGWNLSFDYQLICPEGPFAYSGAKNHYLDFTTNYFSSDSRLQAHGGIIWQSFTIDENGGITDDNYFTSGEMRNQSGLPMTLSGSGTTHLRRNAFAGVTYNIVSQVERTRQRDSLSVRNITADDGTVKIIADTIEVTDTLRTSKPLSFNAGVFGLEASYSRRERSAYLTGYSNTDQWDEVNATLFWTNDAYPDYRWRNPFKLTLGITPRRISGYFRSDTTKATPDTLSALCLVNPFAKAQILVGNLLLSLDAEFDNTLRQLDTAVSVPDYRGSASLMLFLDTLRQSGIEAKATLLNAIPNVRMLHATHYTLKPIRDLRYELHLFRQSGTPKSNLFIDLNLSATSKSHAAWYDSTLTVRKGKTGLWLFQAALTMRMKWRWLHFDMQQLLQYSTDTVQLPLPLWTSKNSLYADFPLFSGALRLQVGTDLRCYTAFAPSQYDPATGLFYRQDTKTGNYLWADAFLNLQVKRVSIYLKGGHLNALWESHPNYFLLPHYPGQRFGFFWGITWHFFD